MFNQFATPETQVQNAIGADVPLRWVGRPAQGLLFRTGDLLMIPFSLLWGGFAIFWESTAISDGGPIFFRLWGIPFVLIGLYMIAGRFIVDAYLRAHTTYAIGDHAIYFVRDGLANGVSTLAASALTPVQMQLGANGRGTIIFADSAIRFFNYSASWRMTTAPDYAFESIPDVQKVYEMINSIR